MNRPAAWPGTDAWARHLAAPAPAPRTALTPAEALRVQRHRDRLLAALQARDRSALRGAQQAVLQAAYAQPATPALRQALRLLAWHMAALLPSRRGEHAGI